MMTANIEADRNCLFYFTYHIFVFGKKYLTTNAQRHTMIASFSMLLRLKDIGQMNSGTHPALHIYTFPFIYLQLYRLTYRRKKITFMRCFVTRLSLPQKIKK